VKKLFGVFVAALLLVGLLAIPASAAGSCDWAGSAPATYNNRTKIGSIEVKASITCSGTPVMQSLTISTVLYRDGSEWLGYQLVHNTNQNVLLQDRVSSCQDPTVLKFNCTGHWEADFTWEMVLKSGETWDPSPPAGCQVSGDRRTLDCAAVIVYDIAGPLP
jgi:hypothetical protein